MNARLLRGRWPLDREPAWPPPEGQFGAVRKHDIHTGVDLYCEPGDLVKAIWPGRVIGCGLFTGPEVGTPWWNKTYAVMVQSAEASILYGEIDFCVELGQELQASDVIGRVMTVLKKDKGRPMTMLHLEAYKDGRAGPVSWELGQPQPEDLLDPVTTIWGETWAAN